MAKSLQSDCSKYYSKQILLQREVNFLSYNTRDRSVLKRKLKNNYCQKLSHIINQPIDTWGSDKTVICSIFKVKFDAREIHLCGFDVTMINIHHNYKFKTFTTEITNWRYSILARVDHVEDNKMSRSSVANTIRKGILDNNVGLSEIL